MALEPRIEAIRKKYDLNADDFWQIKQNGQWVCKHSALEVVALKANVEWLQPTIIEANAPELVTSMIVTGKMGDRIEWATGETNATNYSVKGKQPAYPWAMSEKRAKDRVILKLVGIHGFVYSDAEADFSMPDDEPEKRQTHKERTGQTIEETRPIWKEMADEIANCQSIEELFALWSGTAFKAEYAKLPASWQVEILNAKDVRKEELTGAA